MLPENLRQKGLTDCHQLVDTLGTASTLALADYVLSALVCDGVARGEINPELVPAFVYENTNVPGSGDDYTQERYHSIAIGLLCSITDERLLLLLGSIVSSFYDAQKDLDLEDEA